jgi:quaternary ammonium compound-resistance protein SugE
MCPGRLNHRLFAAEQVEADVTRHPLAWGVGACQREEHALDGRRTRELYPASDKTAMRETVMSWFVLVLSGVLEAVWATALGKSEGFTRLGPTITFFVGLGLSMVGLAYAMRSLPVGTAYAVWVGIGAVLTVGYSMATGQEAVSVVKVLLLGGIVGCVVGLKLVH